MDNLDQQHNYKKFLKDQLATSELGELHDWINSTEFDQYAADVWNDFDDSSFEVDEQVQKEIYFKISQEINDEKINLINTLSFFRSNLSRLMKVAAVVLFLILSTFVARHFIMDSDDPI
jgi:hypothetical protein